ncbi:hypothetical protein ACHAXR_004676 [Thalassiosira sp. AJA248-18]
MKGGRNKRRAASKNHAKPQSKVIVCAVCGKGDGKYKCPKCRAPFCCVQCSKDHKAKCPASSNNNATETADAVAATTTNSIVDIANEQSKYLSQKELKSIQPPRKRVRRSASDDESDDSHDDEPGWNITPEMKKRIHQSAWLRKELQDGGLRQLIDQIDAASDDDGGDDHNSNNRKDYQRSKTTARVSARELALARTKHSHPKFASFVDQMLLTAGVLQPAAGGDGSISSMLEGHGPLVLAPVPRRGGAMTANQSDSESDNSSSDSEDDDDSGSSGESDGSNDSGGS